jgi:hypothetical protein
MNQHADFLHLYLLSTAKEGGTLLFQPPSWFRCNAAPSAAGFVAGTLVRWNMIAVTLCVHSSKRGYQCIIIPSSWVRGFPLHLSTPCSKESVAR